MTWMKLEQSDQDKAKNMENVYMKTKIMEEKGRKPLKKDTNSYHSET